MILLKEDIAIGDGFRFRETGYEDEIRQTINYTLDTSDEEQFEYTIIDKETRISSGRYRTNLYYLKVIINGNEEELNVDSYIYHTYEIDDTIELTYHEGYLGYSYYELEEHDGLIGLFK